MVVLLSIERCRLAQLDLSQGGSQTIRRSTMMVLYQVRPSSLPPTCGNSWRTRRCYPSHDEPQRAALFQYAIRVQDLLSRIYRALSSPTVLGARLQDLTPLPLHSCSRLHWERKRGQRPRHPVGNAATDGVIEQYGFPPDISSDSARVESDQESPTSLHDPHGTPALRWRGVEVMRDQTGCGRDRHNAAVRIAFR